MTRDYIPRNDAHFNDWYDNLLTYVKKMKTQWTYIPPSSITELDAAFLDWDTFYRPTLTPHTPAVTVAKNEARRRSETVVRNFVQRFLHWPPVTDYDRTNMNIPLRDHIRTPHIDVTEMVEFELTLRHIREIMVNFWIKGALNHAKPQGYDGAVIVWDVLDAPPETPDMLNRHQMASRTPHSLEFDETERGRTVYITAAWQNERGFRGQWAEIQSAVIP